MKTRTMLAALAAAVLLAGCGHVQVPGHAATHDFVAGSITVRDYIKGDNGGACVLMSSGYDDIHQGTQVTMSNASGKVVAVTELEEPSLDSHYCVFAFVFHDVPDMDFYQLEVSHRGELVKSRAELDADGWAVHMTLG